MISVLSMISAATCAKNFSNVGCWWGTGSYMKRDWKTCDSQCK